MNEKVTLPPCYGEDDCSTAIMSICTFADSCGKNLTEQQAKDAALLYWRKKADEYLHKIRFQERQIVELENILKLKE